MDYRTWLRQQEQRSDPIGDLAREARQDKMWNGSQRQMRLKLSTTDTKLDVFEQSIKEFRASKPTYKRRTAKGPYKLSFKDWEHTFKTKKEMTDYYRGVKQRGRIRALTDEETKAVFALLINHPCHPVFGTEKLTVGIHPIDNTICFKLDNCPISFNLCITSMGNNDRIPVKYGNFFKAARNEIHDQIAEMDKNKGEHVDHVTFFCHLLHDWLHESGHKLSEIACVGSSFELFFKDRCIAQEWIYYHREHAVLRRISAEENMARKPAMLDWSVHVD